MDAFEVPGTQMFLAGFVDERTRTYAFSRSTGSSGEKGRGLCITCIRLKGERVDCSLHGVEMLGTKGTTQRRDRFPRGISYFRYFAT